MELKNNFWDIFKTISFSLSILLVGLILFYIGDFEKAFLPYMLLLFIIIDFPSWVFLLTYYFKNLKKVIEISENELILKKKNGTILEIYKLVDVNKIVVYKSQSDIIRHSSMKYFYLKVELNQLKCDKNLIYITCLMTRKIDSVLENLKNNDKVVYDFSMPFIR